LLWRLTSLLPLPLLMACVSLRPTRTPILHQTFAPQSSTHRTLIVLLPGIRDTEQHFVRHGFIDAVRERQLPIDMVAADAHLAYYTEEIIDTRLIEDIIAPARASGYERVILAGTSLGGLGALITARKHADQVDGVILIAPFLGRAKVVSEIQAAGGPAAWTPPELDPDDFERELWVWLRRAELPPAVVACGERDRFIGAARMLAELLPPDRLVTLPGGHDWKSWQALWLRLLDGPELVEAGVLTRE
jgi:pimeloyl-ACP methyl ester carboxylesterase